MDVLKGKRTVLRTAFTRLYNTIENILLEVGDRAIDDINLSANFELLSEKYNELSQLNEEILNHLLNQVGVEQAVLDSEEEVADGYSTKFKRINLLFKAKSVVKEENYFDACSVASISKRKFKLPFLELKKYGGEIKDWLPFWGQFSKIDSDPDIDDADKFQYLIQATIPNTRARELVESFPPSSENYSKAIKCLKSRFGREELLVEYYVRELLKLTFSMNIKDQKVNLSVLYDRIETQLRALESLGVATDKYAAMLFPLVESCLSEELLRAWQRSNNFYSNANKNESRLENLMQFLKTEVENEERITLAMKGFSVKENIKVLKSKREQPTAAELFSGHQEDARIKICTFCDKKNHESKDCHFARNLKPNERNEILARKKSCFRCLRPGHFAKQCRSKIFCEICHKRHYKIMCPEKESRKREENAEITDGAKSQFNSLANPTCSPKVLLQTLIVHLRGKENDLAVRALIDTGSQRSYISKEVARRMKYPPVGEEELVHNLFGGVEKSEKHKLYEVFVSSYRKDYHCKFKALDQEKICADIPRITDGYWKKEVRDKNIFLSDQEIFSRDFDPAIHLLIGADIAGKLLTGNIKELSGGLIAVETLIGWTLMGKQNEDRYSDSYMTVLSLHVDNRSIRELWDLDTLGILDPAEKQSQAEIEEQTTEVFLNTIKQDDDGRYVVSLPWLENRPDLPSNRTLSEQRLKTSVNRIKNAGILKEYENCFKDWQEENIIEEIENEKLNDANCHYLPHRPVIKENSTTKIRPVFDGSAKMKNCPSLNDCLVKGPNLVELIPSILNRFRIGRYGVIADIRKAFLQIRLNENDKEYLRFLWWEEGDPNCLKIFRHCRVVFGIKSSPFLLGATINYHLDRMPEEFQKTSQHLKKAMYVDNCVASVETKEELEKFISESRQIMTKGQFDLRGWQHNLDKTYEIQDETSTNREIPVLGLLWNLETDTLKVDIRNDSELEANNVTKRNILSKCHKIFDPIGFTVPITLIPKILLQECWKIKANWDERLPDDIVIKFKKWEHQLRKLKELEILRWFGGNVKTTYSLHVFCDASQNAYAACIFLRSETENKVNNQLVAARSRVAPLNKVTISRLELLACTIGIRLANTIKLDLESLGCIPTHYWSDSMNCLYWIKNDEQWATFVMNRVREIRTHSTTEQWNHISGNLNPADLPSRGCSVEALISKKWWEGPHWLKEMPENWPKSHEFPDKEIVNAEKKKTVTTTLNISSHMSEFLSRYSSFDKLLRIMAYVFRFIRNCHPKKSCRLKGALSAEEIKNAEDAVLKMVQTTSFNSVNDARLKSFQPFFDAKGLIRMKTRLIMRKDTENFRCPIILPSDHPVVQRLIFDKHRKLLHCGIQTLLSNLRENYWILKGRKTIRKVLKQCAICQRFTARHSDVVAAPLPEDRIREASVFEITGIDFAGPLYLKDGTKSWIVLFTCAVYRAIHLELVSSLSTDKFLLALRRFVARRGRPLTVYTDNGKSFVGANNALQKIDWTKVVNEENARRILWKFIPPSSPWWGGWWERLVALVKNLLKRVLGKASLKYEEMNSLLCECESVVNLRPLTYVSEDKELEPLTPSMFLSEMKEYGVPDLDHLESTSLQKRHTYRIKLREDLRKRFRLEYLGLLRQNTKKIRNNKNISIGDIVLVENRNLKRIFWPFGKIIEVFPGKDGIIRLVKVKTQRGEILRPVQRLYSLEIASTLAEPLRSASSKVVKTAVDEKEKEPREKLLNQSNQPNEDRKRPTVQTRTGRPVKPINRLNL